MTIIIRLIIQEEIVIKLKLINHLKEEAIKNSLFRLYYLPKRNNFILQQKAQTNQFYVIVHP